MPAFMLKKIVLGNFAKGPVDPKMADAIDFMVDRVSNSYSCSHFVLVIPVLWSCGLNLGKHTFPCESTGRASPSLLFLSKSTEALSVRNQKMNMR